jgi:hypothetical protein
MPRHERSQHPVTCGGSNYSVTRIREEENQKPMLAQAPWNKHHGSSAKARTKEALDMAVVEALASISPEKARPWLCLCGYTKN